MGVVEEVGRVVDTREGVEEEVACLEVVMCPEMEGGAVRTVEGAMGVGAVGGWAVTTMGRGASPPVEAEVVVDVELETVLWKWLSVPEACPVFVLVRTEVSSFQRSLLSRNAFYCGAAEPPLLLWIPARQLLAHCYPLSWPEQSYAASR
jgi:hypothetical protein